MQQHNDDGLSSLSLDLLRLLLPFFSVLGSVMKHLLAKDSAFSLMH